MELALAAETARSPTPVHVASDFAQVINGHRTQRQGAQSDLHASFGRLAQR